MKTKIIIAVAALCTLYSGKVMAAHLWEDPNVWWAGHFTYDTTTAQRYTAAELSFDAFGSYVAAERRFSKLFETNIRHGDWGGGVGLNYFFTRQIGISGDINIGDNGGKFVDQAMGALVARLPFDPSGWAPYIFGGGGRGFDPAWEWLGQAGIGVEYRFNPATGVFFDSRYIWHDKSYDRIMFRAGLRIVF
jgi:Outer membrane protein beta-barrel domain